MIKRKLILILTFSSFIFSSCSTPNECENSISNNPSFSNTASITSNSVDNSKDNSSKGTGYYCDLNDHSYFDGRLEHKYYIYTDLFKDNQSVTYDKTGEINFKITFYHQLDKWFFLKHRNPSVSTYFNPLSFQYRFKNDQNYQGIVFDIEDGEKMYKDHFKNPIVEEFCEVEEKDYTLDVSISIDKLLKFCNYESTPVYMFPCFNATEDGYYYQANGFRYELLEVVDGVDASFYLEVNEDSISIRDMK